MDIDQLKSNLLTAINQFNTNRANILATADQQMGQDAVAQLEEKYDELNNQYDQLLQAALDLNSEAYASLSDQANAEGIQLQQSVANLDNINQTITLISSVIAVVASIVAL